MLGWWIIFMIAISLWQSSSAVCANARIFTRRPVARRCELDGQGGARLGVAAPADAFLAHSHLIVLLHGVLPRLPLGRGEVHPQAHNAEAAVSELLPQLEVANTYPLKLLLALAPAPATRNAHGRPLAVAEQVAGARVGPLGRLAGG